MKDNIIKFKDIRNRRIELKQYGIITIKVYEEPKTKCPIFYIKPDNEGLSEIVNIIDDTLTHTKFIG